LPPLRGAGSLARCEMDRFTVGCLPLLRLDAANEEKLIISIEKE